MRAVLSPVFRAKIYRILAWLPVGLLILHLGMRWGFATQDSQLDLWLFNAIALSTAATNSLRSPLTSLAIASWALGSIGATTAYFYGWPKRETLLNNFYLAFYPLLFAAIFIAIQRANKPRKQLAYLALALIGSYLVLLPLLPHFSNLPLTEQASAQFDLALLLIGLLLLRSAPQIWFSLGALTFASYDLWFLHQMNQNHYQFAQLSDNLWLVALIALGYGSKLLGDLKMPGDSMYLAYVDELTNLPNRRAFLTWLADISDPATVLLMDLDGFKQVNDQYGHKEGDFLLQAISKRFLRALPPNARLARLGGDEFAVLINDEEFIGDETANALAATTSYPISIDDRLHYIGISIGKVHNDGGGDLLARADSAMYEAKRAGENIVGWGDHS